MGITITLDEGRVWAKVDGSNEELALVKSILSYEKEFYVDTYKGKQRKVTTGSLLNRRKKFPAGLTSRVVSSIKAQGVSIDWESALQFDNKQPTITIPQKTSEFPLTLKEKQKRAMETMLSNSCGVIKAPPRTGKTVIAGSFISLFLDEQCLFLVDTKSLMKQTISEFTEKFGMKVNKIGDGTKKLGKHKITVAMKQTLANMIEEKMISKDYFSVIIVDECHHAGAGEDSQYWKILTYLQPVYKIGLTATPPPDKYPNMVMEGLLGPIIYEIEPNKESQAIPKLRIIKAPTNKRLERLSYRETVEEGIIFNRGLNRLIVNTTETEAKEGKSTLIIVSQVLHGFYLEELFATISFLDVPFLCGGLDAESARMLKNLSKQKSKTEEEKEAEQRLTDIRRMIKNRSDNREAYRQKFINKSLKAVIATVQLWGEGIDIPSLDTIILGHIGKSQIRVIQTGSRPLTKTDRKEVGTIIDIFDNSNRYLVSHFGERMCMYSDLGWLGG